uniref:ATP-binding cassette transporter subfamily A member 5 X2 protein n=1 Tax=Brachionus koreanus TaxID=1199090 RepID=A0A1J0MMV8_9BILA|nr:ATP-binding cassette transporter subfamily A member 5 X2 protein [Brachionus koreanus]
MKIIVQIFGFIKRNIKLRYRNKILFGLEIYQLIAITVFLIILTFLFPAKDYKPEEYAAKSVKYNYLDKFLYICPNSSEIQKLGSAIESEAGYLKVRYFSDKLKMRDFFVSQVDKNHSYTSIFGVEFDQFPSKYKLYHEYLSSLYNDNKAVYFSNGNQCRKSEILTFETCSGNVFVYDGTSFVQYHLNKAIVKYFNKTYPNFKVKLMAKGKYSQEVNTLTGLSSYYFTLLYAYSLTSFVINIVAEKEKKIKEQMKMMGMLVSTFWISWILTFLIQFTITNLIITLVLFAIGFFKSFVISIIFFFLIQLFSIVAIVFGSLISVFFQKSKTAGSAVSIIYSIMSLLYFLVFLPRIFNTRLPLWLQWILSVIFQFSFSVGVDQLLFIQAEYGANFPSKFFANPARPNSLSILSCLLMLIADGVLYFILTLYFENVIQGEYGRSKSPIFFLKPSFWLKRKKYDNETNFSEINNFQLDCEPVGDEFKDKIALKINNLVKRFKNEKGFEYNAIDNLNLTVYSDQITAILGHNGAGKTTLFNILTGLLTPDSGTARFFNFDILSDRDLNDIRKMSGVCLQQDVLYDLLDCYEHLELYAYLKNMPRNQIKEKIEETLSKVGLIDCKHSRANQLSGGQKRKLSIAIALIGDPKILILDEPTSGMDPSSRREIWSLLQSLRQNRVILLSTHFMDEADILADRKAIISKGKLKCVGSSLYLKNRFGLGYHLKLIANQNIDQEPVELTSMIKRHVANGELERFSGKEISYTLPIDSVGNFQSLFEDIEKNAQSIDIENFAISMTLLEEVFLKLADEVHDEKEDDNPSDSNIQLEIKFRPAFFKFIPANYFTIFKLRFLMAFRFKVAFLYRFVFPIPSILLSIILPKIIKSLNFVNTNNLPTIDLAINEYSTVKNPFLIVNKSNVDHLVNSLVVNYQLNPQPIKFAQSESNISFNNYAGLIHPENKDDLVLFYNDSAVFSVPYLINTYTNLLCRMNGISLLNASLTTWPPVKNDDSSFFDANSFTTLIILGISLIFPLVSFAAEVVQDREQKCKSQLRLSGCEFWNYWIPTLTAYLIQSSFLPIILFFFIYAIPPLNIAEFMPSGAVFCIFLTTIIYIPLNLLFVMCLSFIFTKKETTLSFLFTFLLLIFTIPYLIVTLSQISSLKTSNILHIVFTLVDPVYAFIGNYNRIAQVYLNQKVEDIKLGKNSTTVPFSSYFEFNLYFIPLTLIFGLINIFIYAFLLYFIESLYNGINLFDKITGNKRMIWPNYDTIQNEDSDVKLERDNLSNNNLETCPLSVNEIRKDFSKKYTLTKQIQKFNNLFSRKRNNASLQKIEKKIAVRNLSIGFRQGEIFGLLGTNGAGKTTTINMICAELKPDAGLIKIKNEPFSLKNIQLFCQSVAVCPQHNPFWEELTLIDHLKIYGSLKKLSDQEIMSLSFKFMEMLGITEHCEKKVKNLSGGTKRKLAYAITLFGNPEITLLDEPSTGLDPQSKRKFWNAISETLVMTNKSAILTTHSMEEAEALCHRIGIMVNGELKCLGSSQYLKEKFGADYLLEMKINVNKTEELNLILNELFNGQAIQLDCFLDHRLYSIPKNVIKSLGRIFKVLENAKYGDLIRQYDFSQTTLEQVFMQFAKS